MEGIEEITELGGCSYIYSEYRGIFKINGFNDYTEVENSTVMCLLKAFQIKKKEPTIKRIDLYARVLTDKSILTNELPGVVLFEIYLTQKTSNGVCESVGRLSNLIREGVRARMGLLFLEVNLRLHFVSPLEEAWNWFEYVRKVWVNCGGQQSKCKSSAKRVRRKETVNPVGNEDVRSYTSKSMAKKRRLASRIAPLLSYR